MIFPIFLNNSEKYNPISFSPIYFTKSPFLIINLPYFYIYRMGTNYLLVLILYVSPSSTPRVSRKLYYSLYIFHCDTYNK